MNKGPNMKNLLNVLSLVFSFQLMASDLGESQARRVLDLLSIQENGDVAYYVGGLLSNTPPQLVDISKISFSSRKVEKDSL